MDLDAIEIFVKVVQAGSFSQAARVLGLPATTVSFKVAKLEKRLGTTLIQRTTRKLHVTPAGQRYFEHCLRGLDEIKTGEAELESSEKDPSGILRISAASDVAHFILAPLIILYLKRYVQVGVDLVITSREVDLISEGIDVAIRAGELDDSSLIARPMKKFKGGIWASESYLRGRGPVKAPQDLEAHDVLLFTHAAKILRLSNGKTDIRINPKGRIYSDELETLFVLASMGAGIGILPDFLAENRLNQGKLVRLIPEWSWGELKLSLVYPAQRFVSPKLRAFIELAMGEK